MEKRLLSAQIETDLAKKMVLLSGPSQSGKITLARALLPGVMRAAQTRYLLSQLGRR